MDFKYNHKEFIYHSFVTTVTQLKNLRFWDMTNWKIVNISHALFVYRMSSLKYDWSPAVWLVFVSKVAKKVTFQLNLLKNRHFWDMSLLLQLSDTYKPPLKNFSIQYLEFFPKIIPVLLFMKNYHAVNVHKFLKIIFF